jgi:hypothetical protein
MKTKTIGWIAALLAALTALWIVLLVWSSVSAGPLDTFEQMLAYARRGGALYFLTYLNATMLTLVAVMFFAALYVFTRSQDAVWSAIALSFIPIYGLLNLFAYFSQISLVPRLLALSQTPEHQALAEFLLRQLIQQSPDSAVGIFNNLAYAILGIPSIIYGRLLFRMHPSLRLGAVLLALNGIACIIGISGILLNNGLLSLGSLVGGAFFLLALIPLSQAFLGQRE